MAQIERQQTVLNILRNLRDLGGLKKLFWEELNYERELRLLIGNTTNREKVIGLVESRMKKAESLKSTGNRQRRR